MEPPEQTRDRWWHLDTDRSKLIVMGVIVGMGWLASPLGPIALIAGLNTSEPGTFTIQGVAMGIATALCASIAFFPIGLTYPIPELRHVSNTIGLTLWMGGWVLYGGLFIAILRSRRKWLVRMLLLSFVVLIIWNTAGCYPMVARL
jgi:hypothetical protein